VRVDCAGRRSLTSLRTAALQGDAS